MSKVIAPTKDIWDKTTQLDNKPTVTNRLAAVVIKVRDLHKVSEGKAVEGLINGTYNYQEILKELQKDYCGI